MGAAGGLLTAVLPSSLPASSPVPRLHFGTGWVPCMRHGHVDSATDAPTQGRAKGWATLGCWSQAAPHTVMSTQIEEEKKFKKKRKKERPHKAKPEEGGESIGNLCFAKEKSSLAPRLGLG